MALLYPLRGYRYDPKVVGDLARVVTQPYDKISPELQRDYYGRSPFNVARITKSLEKDADPDTDYPEAGATFECWIRERALVAEKAPAVYAYYQEYKHEDALEVRKGFIALLDLRHAGTGILPHERTLA